MSAADEAIGRSKDAGGWNGPWRFQNAAYGIVEEPIVMDAAEEIVAHCVTPALGALVAEAPAMAEALRVLVEDFAAHGYNNTSIQEARAILARITGDSDD
jgi:hypothetical protein